MSKSSTRYLACVETPESSPGMLCQCKKAFLRSSGVPRARSATPPGVPARVQARMGVPGSAFEALQWCPPALSRKDFPSPRVSSLSRFWRLPSSRRAL
eukprot:6086188-Pyramimonas_sp.AAC.1